MDWIIAGSEIPADQVEGFKTSGIYDGGRHERIGLSDFIGDPEGHPLDTPSGRIELSPAAYADTGYAAHPHFRGILEHPDLPLMLVTPHSLFRINSTGSNIPWIRDGDPVRLRIHPADALPRGIGNGDAVTVTGESGTMRITAAVTEDIMPGVVSCPQGGWLGADPSANVVTSLDPTMPSVSTRTHTVFVEVTKIDRTEETP